MDLIDYLRALRASWWLLLVGAVLGGGLAATAVGMQEPRYQTTTQLFVSTTGASDVASAIQGSEFSQQRVGSYARLLMGKDLAEAVRERLDLDLTVDQLTAEIEAEAVPDTVLLDVVVTDTSPERALAVAEAIDVEFAELVTQLETPAGAASSPITVTTVATPELPTEPSSPDGPRSIAVGVVLGLLAGAGLAVLWRRLDTSVRDDDTAAELAGAPVVGRVVRDPALERAHTVDWAGGGPAAEAFRQLRTNVQFLRPDSPLRSIMVTSGLAGEGKSTVAVNLARALAESGRQVVLVEADLRRPRAVHYLGLVGGVGLTNVLTGQAELDDVLQPYGDGRLTVLGAGPTAPNPGELLGSQSMRLLLDQLAERYDVVVVDAPPVLPVADTLGLASLVDGVLLCLRHGQTTRVQLAQTSETLERVQATTVGVVHTMVPPRALKEAGLGYGYGYGEEHDRRGWLRRQPGDRTVAQTAPAGRVTV